MQPRRDPETYPAAMNVQVLTRRLVDQYGNERGGRGRDAERKRILETRNGLPEKPYRYRGTGYCMTEKEAQFWLRKGRNVQ